MKDYYLEAMRADTAYSAELQRMYGKDAGEARYDARGEATKLLVDLANEKHDCDNALIEYMKKSAA